MNRVTRTTVLISTSLILLTLGVVVVLLWPPAVSNAEPTLPPRDPPTATPIPQATEAPNPEPTQPPEGEAENENNTVQRNTVDGQITGAYIVLNMVDAPAGTWSVVEWQDSVGNWHTVEGWQAQVERSKRWWVHPKDFNTGPFRWTIRSSSDSEFIQTSEPFTLPRRSGQVVQITVASD